MTLAKYRTRRLMFALAGAALLAAAFPGPAPVVEARSCMGELSSNVDGQTRAQINQNIKGHEEDVPPGRAKSTIAQWRCP
jgi:hypothetical protein